ncbi:MAG: hypothetical protein H0V12_03210 [Chloroflexi bacterium]|nr:hypothetical protein [Chloroflexota bacterium]
MNDHHGTDPRQRIEDARAEAAALLVQLPETERNEFGDLEERIAEISNSADDSTGEDPTGEDPTGGETTADATTTAPADEAHLERQASRIEQLTHELRQRVRTREGAG